jgi:hypothetical protein
MWNGIESYKARWNMHALVASDFKLNLDMEHNYKPRSPRSTNIVKDFMEEFNFDDAVRNWGCPRGGAHITPKPQQIGLHFHSVGLIKKSFTTTWGGGGQAEILEIFQMGMKNTWKLNNERLGLSYERFPELFIYKKLKVL